MNNIEKNIQKVYWLDYHTEIIKGYEAVDAFNRVGIMSNVKDDFGDNPLETISKICYNYADAMIEQRKK